MVFLFLSASLKCTRSTQATGLCQVVTELSSLVVSSGALLQDDGSGKAGVRRFGGSGVRGFGASDQGAGVPDSPQAL